MVMEEMTMLFQEVVDALSTAGSEDLVAVWPASATEFVEELQLLSENEGQRLLRIGLQLGPEAAVKKLYCFRNAPACDGLTVCVFQLVQITQTRTSIRWRVVQSDGQQDPVESVWKVQRTPIATETTPPRRVDNTETKSISPEEKQRKRRWVESDNDDAERVDEVRPPTKMRRLNDNGEGISATVDPGRFDTCNNDPAVVRSSTVIYPGSLEGSGSGSSGDSSEEEGITVASATSDKSEQNVSRTALQARKVSRLRERANGRDAVLMTLKRVIAAGLAVDSDDEDDTGSDKDAKNFDAVPQAQDTSFPAPEPDSLAPLRAVLENASTQVYRAVNGFRNLTSVLKVLTSNDSDAYDLLWTEENDPFRWTMFGEPSIPSRPAVRTRSKRREVRRSRSTWKFW